MLEVVPCTTKFTVSKSGPSIRECRHVEYGLSFLVLYIYSTFFCLNGRKLLVLVSTPHPFLSWPREHNILNQTQTTSPPLCKDEICHRPRRTQGRHRGRPNPQTWPQTGSHSSRLQRQQPQRLESSGIGSLRWAKERGQRYRRFSRGRRRRGHRLPQRRQSRGLLGHFRRWLCGDAVAEASTTFFLPARSSFQGQSRPL